MRVSYRVKGDLNIAITFDKWGSPVTVAGPNLRARCWQGCPQGCVSRTGFCTLVDQGIKRQLSEIEKQFVDKPLTDWQCNQIATMLMPVYRDILLPPPSGKTPQSSTLNNKIQSVWRFIFNKAAGAPEPEGEESESGESGLPNDLIEMPIYFTVQDYVGNAALGWDYCTVRDAGYYWRNVVKRLILAALDLVEREPEHYAAFRLDDGQRDHDFVHFVEREVWRLIKTDYDVNYRSLVESHLKNEAEIETNESTTIDTSQW